MEDQQSLANTIIDELRRTKKIHDEYADLFYSQYRISGKLMGEWREYFLIKIPPDLNPRGCQEFDIKLMELYQEASFLKSACECRLQAWKTSRDSKFRDEFIKLHMEYKNSGTRAPAKETLELLAKKKSSDLSDAVVHSEIELAFWKDILDDLSYKRKLIENITINLSVELKASNNERYLDSLNSKSNGG